MEWEKGKGNYIFDLVAIDRRLSLAPEALSGASIEIVQDLNNKYLFLLIL